MIFIINTFQSKFDFIKSNFLIKNKISILFTFLFLNISFSVFSQIPTISFQCVTTLSSGDVQLNWSPAPATCGPFVSQDIYFSTSAAGPYTLLVSMTDPTDNTYVHVGANGNIITYHYYIVNNYSCALLSPASDTLDNLFPATPLINYVSVNASNQSVINWQESVSPETYGYIIYYLNGVTATPIDTIYGSTNYVDISSDANTISQDYTVAAIDSCLSTGLFSTVPHHNILLTKINDLCSTVFDLSWNAYDNWASGIGQYKIQISTNGGPFVPINISPSGNEIDTFRYASALDGDQICVYVEAVSGDGIYSSSSNTICFTIQAVQAPSFIYIENINVLPDNSIETIWNIDPNADILQTNIYASQDSSFSSPTTVPLTNPLAANDTSLLSNQSPNTAPVFVSIETIDSCDKKKVGNYGKTIYLKGRVNDNYTIDLNWTFFKLQNANVQSYQLYRIDQGSRFFVASFSPFDFYYNDANAYIPNQDTIIYEIEASFKGNFPDGTTKDLNSVSNRVAFTFQTKIIVPNAFTPGGDNPIFKPYILSGDPLEYSFNVSDKWGTIVFETTDINAFWDGKYNGEYMNTDVYPWFIKVKGADGKVYTEKGSVLLLR